jgi:aspartate aminotransferase/aminotransferase
MYAPHVEMVGGRVVLIDTYPDFRIDVNRVRDAMTDRTKMILLNSPSNPTGVVATESEVRALALLAAERDVVLVSDEIYRQFCYDDSFISPATFNPQTLVIDGFSKTYAVTGWRVGFAHGPAEWIDAMVKLQQYTYVCAPQPAQWAAAVALDVDVSEHVEAYRRKRDRLVDALAGHYDLVRPGGAFYVFLPIGEAAGTEFVARAIERNLLIIPGAVFSTRDTHVRISYAAPDETIDRGIDVLVDMAPR